MIMKKWVLVFAVMLGAAPLLNAQRIVYVDTEYILTKMADYKTANKKIDTLAGQWKEEITQHRNAIQRQKDEFKNKEYLLTQQQKAQKQSEIANAEQNLRTLQNQRFGPNGNLFKKRQDLIKPIQDRIYNAIKKMAEQRGYDIVLDKSEGISILYADTTLDKSEEIIRILKLNKK